MIQFIACTCKFSLLVHFENIIREKVMTNLKSMMAVVLPRDAHKDATRKVVANLFLFNLFSLI